ncbi:phosphoserine phosphatase SerB [Candidatus Micrarchaeota archaeon]|nr:phosphoserine phosphatase SerB [Candidatus Micrarchaeota archaeon]
MLEERLISFDFDSTLIRQEIIDELADLAGKRAYVAKITRETMEGKHRFSETIHLKTRALAGLTQNDLHAVASRIQYRDNFLPFVSWLKKNSFKIAVITGSFSNVLSILPHGRVFDYVHANELVVQNKVLTGQCIARVTDNKGDLLLQIQNQTGIPPERTISVGDGATDVSMFENSAHSIAFNAKPAVKQKASLALDGDDLMELVPHVQNVCSKHFA